MDNKHNTETSCNGYPISMYKGGPLHELYFIAINNHGWAIIGPNKKIVATHVVGELESIGLIHENMNAEKRVLLQLMPHGFSMN